MINIYLLKTLGAGPNMWQAWKIGWWSRSWER